MEENKVSVNVGVVIFFFLLFVGFMVIAFSFNSEEKAQPTPTPDSEIKLNLGGDNKNLQEGLQDVVSDLQVEDLVVGEGKEAQIGNKVTVNYRGTLLDGVEFDSSYKREEPFSFILGQGQVIQGWERGILGMKEGGKRKLVIPPSLGYGQQQVGLIPPNSVLVFEVELLQVDSIE